MVHVLKANQSSPKILEVITKTLEFHTSTNYQIKAPQPFTSEVHEDILLDLNRIKQQKYSSDYDLHVDIFRSLKRLNDGLYTNYLPIPLALLTDEKGNQDVYIAPEAFTVASAEFGADIEYWQNALPGTLKGKLSSLSGAKVLLINALPPFAAVNANAAIAGSYQALGARQNGQLCRFFSSYRRVAGGWTYLMGNFAQQSLPLSDSVLLTVQRVNRTIPDTFLLPYRSKRAVDAFGDTSGWRSVNCKAKSTTNGQDIYSDTVRTQSRTPSRYVNQLIDESPFSNVILPPTLVPILSPVDGSYNAAQFYLLQDKKTGILALGSFSDADYYGFMNNLLKGLLELKSLGATQLIVDVTNNGGGYICAAHWLHRIIAGPKSTTVPQAGLDTTTRNGALAQLIVKKIIYEDRDPADRLLYNPTQWRDASNNFFAETHDWLQPPIPVIINGRKDAFSQRLGQECQPEGFPSNPPVEALFDPKKVVIVSNARCASSCSLFSIAMQKLEGSRTVVIGGKKDVKQQYCGTIGGQSTSFTTIDTEIKTTGLKNNTLAPPDLMVNGYLGITWRLAYGVDKPTEPAEWQDHPADFNLPLTANLTNNPVAIWEEVSKRLLA
ncbi:hypothetical protein JR316_0008870 [Psilocybe cubensis]|uniref:Uncharacterized protein n=1 Tax=Psilocybe cubensis TaxID=181762 RepID=A0ACB8GTV6_PSICU|nr:hypothetical protein JR316_0008870 [Psilocybe cubensis]KAH9478415.1 hypothetical protein JR316_0008870 [Psilocybe cubensis]